MSESVPVSMQVLGIELVPGAGKVLALANVLVEVSGFSFTVQGIRIMRSGSGVAVEAPHWRHPRSGEHFPSVMLPDDFRHAMAKQILVEVKRRRSEADGEGAAGSPFGDWGL